MKSTASLSHQDEVPLTAVQKQDNKRIPLYFVFAFLIVFAVNGFFIYMALSTNHEVVTQNAYEKGLDFDRITQEVRKLKAEEAAKLNGSAGKP